MEIQFQRENDSKKLQEQVIHAFLMHRSFFPVHQNSLHKTVLLSRNKMVITLALECHLLFSEPAITNNSLCVPDLFV